MFICRHVLRRANTLQARLTARQFASRALLADARGRVEYVRLPPTLRMLSDGANNKDVPGTRPEGDDSREGAQTDVPASPSPPVDAPARPTESRDKIPAIATYFSVRDTHRKAVANFPPKVLLQALDAIAKVKHTDRLHQLAEDVLEIYEGEKRGDRFMVVQRILTLCCEPWWQEGRRRYILQQMLEDLRKRHELDKIPPRLLTTLATTCWFSPTASLNEPVLTILTTIFLHRLGGAHTANYGNGVGLPKSRIMWILFQLISRLLINDMQPQVLPLFKTLLAEKHIPPTALQGVDLTSGDFNQIVLMTMVRTCVQYGWHSRGAQLVIETMSTHTSITPPLADLMEYIINKLLESTEEIHAEVACALVTRLLFSPSRPRIEPKQMTLLYSRLQAHNRPELIVAMYRGAKMAKIRFPIPHSGKLVWLMEHVLQAGDLDTAYSLAVQAVEDDIELPATIRAHFIGLLAETGFTLQARQLYENYAAMRDAKLVVCDGGLLVRLVSLCAGRLRILGNRIQAAEMKRDESVDATSTVDHDLPPSSPGPPGSDTVDDQMPQAPLVHPESEHPLPVEGVVPDHQSMTLEEQRDDIRAFADRVVDNFVRHAGPLEKVAHFQLTSLARAQMLVGRIADCFATLRVLLDRRELPDLTDLNVALASLASISPMRAALALFRLPELGMRPDAVSFGTVIHHACVANDTSTVKGLLRRAARWDVKLDYKTYSTIIRQTALSRTKTYDHVQTVRDAMDSILNLGVVPSPKLGRDCVFIALSANDPAAAFNFWCDYIRDKIEWQDSKHQALRNNVAKLLFRQHRLGRLDYAFCQRAIFELRMHRWLSGLRQPHRFSSTGHAAHRRRRPPSSPTE